MIPVLFRTIDYTILAWCENAIPFPYLRSEYGDKTMWQISPIHGRSYVVGRTYDSNMMTGLAAPNPDRCYAPTWQTLYG